MKFAGMDVSFGSFPKDDPNVQDYVNGQKAMDNHKATRESNEQMKAAKAKLPRRIVHELDERLRRGTI